MPMIKKSITVTDEQEKWIQARMKTGNYASDSEVIREALRERQAKFEHDEWLARELAKGEASGYIEIDAETHLVELKAKLKADGKI